MSRLLALLLCLLASPVLAQNATVTIPSTVVTGPASATSGNCASFNGTTGKIIQDAGAPCGGTSSFTLISTQTASASASLDFTSLAGGTYNTLFLDCNALTLSADDFVVVRYGTGGGPSWQSSNYSNEGVKTELGASTVINATTNSGVLATGLTTSNHSASQPLNFKWYFNNVLSGALSKLAIGQAGYWSGSGTIGVYQGSGFWSGATTAVTGLRVIAGTGATLTTGQCSLYGLTP